MTPESVSFIFLLLFYLIAGTLFVRMIWRFCKYELKGIAPPPPGLIFRPRQAQIEETSEGMQILIPNWGPYWFPALFAFLYGSISILPVAFEVEPAVIFSTATITTLLLLLAANFCDERIQLTDSTLSITRLLIGRQGLTKHFDAAKLSSLSVSNKQYSVYGVTQSNIESISFWYQKRWYRLAEGVSKEDRELIYQKIAKFYPHAINSKDRKHSN